MMMVMMMMMIVSTYTTGNTRHVGNDVARHRLCHSILVLVQDFHRVRRYRFFILDPNFEAFFYQLKRERRIRSTLNLRFIY